MAVGRAKVVSIHSVVVCEFNFCVIRVASIAYKGKRVALLRSLCRAQQGHAKHFGVEVDGALKVADAQHGV